MATQKYMAKLRYIATHGSLALQGFVVTLISMAMQGLVAIPKVYDNARVGGKAIIGEFAEIHENAKVLSNVAIYVVADIRGDSEIRSREDNDKLDREVFTSYKR